VNLCLFFKFFIIPFISFFVSFHVIILHYVYCYGRPALMDACLHWQPATLLIVVYLFNLFIWLINSLSLSLTDWSNTVIVAVLKAWLMSPLHCVINWEVLTLMMMVMMMTITMMTHVLACCCVLHKVNPICLHMVSSEAYEYWWGSSFFSSSSIVSLGCHRSTNTNKLVYIGSTFHNRSAGIRLGLNNNY